MNEIFIFNGIIYVDKEIWSYIKCLNCPFEIKVYLSSNYNNEKAISIPIGMVNFRLIDELMNSKNSTPIITKPVSHIQYKCDKTKDNHHELLIKIEA
jgi:hypothetical protein